MYVCSGIFQIHHYTNDTSKMSFCSQKGRKSSVSFKLLFNISNSHFQSFFKDPLKHLKYCYEMQNRISKEGVPGGSVG